MIEDLLELRGGFSPSLAPGKCKCELLNSREGSKEE
jgi:hypothetical protein